MAEQTADPSLPQAPNAETPAVASAEPTEPAREAPIVSAEPVSYSLKAPEGQAFDEGVIGKFSEVARALNLPQEGAQRILDEVAPALQARSMQALTEFYSDIGGMPDTWADTVRADKELGGPKLDASLATAKKALDLGGDSLRQVLTKTGLGNHPEVIRWAVRIGKALSEDNFVTGGTTATGPTDAASRLYGKN